MTKKIAILQSNYIPWRGYFDIIAKSDVFVIYDEVQYTKNDWRNRNIVKTKTGINWLTIAVKQDSLNQKICDTKILKHNWYKKHLGTLQANYAKAPYYKDYIGVFKEVYESVNDNLSSVNKSFIEAICRILEIDTKIIDSSELYLNGDKQEKLIQACKILNADIYLSGPAAKDYIEIEKFEKENISIEWMNYSNYKEYKQLSEPFEGRVTILDLIFNEGPNSRNFLKY